MVEGRHGFGRRLRQAARASPGGVAAFLDERLTEGIMAPEGIGEAQLWVAPPDQILTRAADLGPLLIRGEGGQVLVGGRVPADLVAVGIDGGNLFPGHVVARLADLVRQDEEGSAELVVGEDLPRRHLVRESVVEAQRDRGLGARLPRAEEHEGTQGDDGPYPPAPALSSNG
jgi:hypothetical protein